MTIKISAMTEATYPLAGTELLEVVQSASSRKATAASLAPTALSAALSANVVLSVSNTWYDGPSITLPAGKWFVSAFLTHYRTTTTAAFVYGRVTDGAATTHYASSQSDHPSLTNSGVSLAMSTVITLGVETVIKLQGATSQGNAAAVMGAALVANASGNTATQISALRVS